MTHTEPRRLRRKPLVATPSDLAQFANTPTTALYPLTKTMATSGVAFLGAYLAAQWAVDEIDRCANFELLYGPMMVYLRVTDGGEAILAWHDRWNVRKGITRRDAGDTPPGLYELTLRDNLISLSCEAPLAQPERVAA